MIQIEQRVVTSNMYDDELLYTLTYNGRRYSECDRHELISRLENELENDELADFKSKKNDV